MKFKIGETYRIHWCGCETIFKVLDLVRNSDGLNIKCRIIRSEHRITQEAGVVLATRESPMWLLATEYNKTQHPLTNIFK